MAQFALTVRLCTALSDEWSSDGLIPPAGCEYSDGFGFTIFKAEDKEEAKSKVLKMVEDNNHSMDGESVPLIPKDVMSLVAQLWGQSSIGSAYAYADKFSLGSDSCDTDTTIHCFSDVEVFVTKQIKRFAQKMVNELSQKTFATS